MQEQALNTNSVRKIYHENVSNKCRLCGTHKENVLLIVSGCSVLAQKEYKRRHDQVCLNIHWALCKKYRVKVCERWYEHKVECVIENDIVKVLWDVCIQVDRQMEHRRPDIMVMEKNTKKCLIIDVACLIDNNLLLKRNEKLDNYSELQLEIPRMWDKETLIVPIIIGALGYIPNDLECNLNKLGISYNVGALQKFVLLGTASIRKVLSIKQRLGNSKGWGKKVGMVIS